MANGGYPASISLHSVCVLVVEHVDDGPRLLASLLRYCGAYVKAAGSAKEALDHMEHLLPDAIVARLPQSDLINLISRIRILEAEQGGAVPIVAIHGEPGAERLLADGALVEPINPWQLCRMVAHFAPGSSRAEPPS